MSDCHVCHGPHDPDYHLAARSVRSWWAETLLKGINPNPKPGKGRPRVDLVERRFAAGSTGIGESLAT